MRAAWTVVVWLRDELDGGDGRVDEVHLFTSYEEGSAWIDEHQPRYPSRAHFTGLRPVSHGALLDETPGEEVDA